jgi:hypothetical protein
VDGLLVGIGSGSFDRLLFGALVLPEVDTKVEGFWIFNDKGHYHA